MAKEAQTFLFYDIESSGLNKCFDQVMQFAAIRTDCHFNELERHQFFVQLSKDTLPTPGAMITHRIGFAQCASGLSEYEAAKQIHYLMNQPNTISLGYNTLGFDDEFLRFTFFRHLLTPYTHQYAHGCSRMDLLPITLLYHLFKPDALAWPKVDGKTSLKLENLSQLNQLADGPAHDAMVDVLATIALAKKLAVDEKMWNYACGYFNKKTELRRIDQLPIIHETDQRLFREALIVQTRIGAKNNYIAPVLSLGQHLHYKNQSLWLRLDDERLQTLTDETLAKCSFVFHKKSAEQHLLLPTEPRFVEKLSDSRWQLAQQNKTWLLENPTLLEALCEHHQHEKYPEVDQVDPQASLYQMGFPNNYDQFQMQQFHLADDEHKSKIAANMANPTYKTLAQRMMAKYFIHVASEDDKHAFARFLNAIHEKDPAQNPIDHVGQRHTSPVDIGNQIKEVAHTPLDAQQTALLSELEQYCLESTSLLN